MSFIISFFHNLLKVTEWSIVRITSTALRKEIGYNPFCEVLTIIFKLCFVWPKKIILCRPYMVSIIIEILGGLKYTSHKPLPKGYICYWDVL